MLIFFRLLFLQMPDFFSFLWFFTKISEMLLKIMSIYAIIFYKL